MRTKVLSTKGRVKLAILSQKAEDSPVARAVQSFPVASASVRYYLAKELICPECSGSLTRQPPKSHVRGPWMKVRCENKDCGVVFKWPLVLGTL